MRELHTPTEWRLAWTVMRDWRRNHDEPSFLAAIGRRRVAGGRSDAPGASSSSDLPR